MTIRELITKELDKKSNGAYIARLLKSTFEINKELQNHFADLYILALDAPTQAETTCEVQNELLYIISTIEELAEAAKKLQDELDKVEVFKKALATQQIDEPATQEQIPF